MGGVAYCATNKDLEFFVRMPVILLYSRIGIVKIVHLAVTIPIHSREKNRHRRN